jgi:hypothetical protein
MFRLREHLPVPTRSYLGPAILVIDLREAPVTVHLEDRRTVDDQREWGGQIQSSDDLLWDALGSGDVRLRIRDQEASINVVSHAVISGSAQIRGSGPAPF